MHSRFYPSVAVEHMDLLPRPEFFGRRSSLHGRLHVAQVMVLGYRLLELTNKPDREIPLWAAIYMHDLSRRHDDPCEQHGTWAVDKVQRTPAIRAVLAGGGLQTGRTWQRR